MQDPLISIISVHNPVISTIYRHTKDDGTDSFLGAEISALQPAVQMAAPQLSISMHFDSIAELAKWHAALERIVDCRCDPEPHDHSFDVESAAFDATMEQLRSGQHAIGFDDSPIEQF